MADEQQSSWLSEMGSALGICSNEPEKTAEQPPVFDGAAGVSEQQPTDGGASKPQEEESWFDSAANAVKDAVTSAYESVTGGDSAADQTPVSADAMPADPVEQSGYEMGVVSNESAGAGDGAGDGPQQESLASLTVKVFFEDNSPAIGAGVTVNLLVYGETATTDATGTAVIFGLPQGDFNVFADLDGAKGQSPIHLEPGKNTQALIALPGLPPAKTAEETEPPDFSPEALNADANALRTASNQLRSGVANAEYFTHQLKSPEGAKGVAYQIAAGTLGLGAAAKEGYDAAKKKVESVTKPITDPEGHLRDKAQDYVLDKKKEKDPSLNESAEKFGETAGTSVELMTGQLNQIYARTRASYGAFQAATAGFDGAYQSFINAVDMLGQLQQLGAMRAQLNAMKDAAQQYLMQCDVLGIRQKAGQLAALDAAIINATKAAVTSSVDLLDPKTGLPKKVVEKAIED